MMILRIVTLALIAVGCQNGPPELQPGCKENQPLEGTGFADLGIGGLKTGTEWRACVGGDSAVLYYRDQDREPVIAKLVGYLTARGFRDGRHGPTAERVLVREDAQLTLFVEDYPNNKGKPFAVSIGGAVWKK